MLPIALQLYSVRDDLQKDFEGTLRKIKAMGYEGAEFALGFFGYTPEDLKALLDEIGLVPISAHVPYSDLLAGPGAALGAYKALGCTYAAVPYLLEEERWTNDRGTIENIRMMAEKAKALGMTLLYHNHDFEYEKIGGEYALDVLFQSIPPELLQSEIDTCWTASVGLDPAAYVRQYTGRAPLVHLKDCVGYSSLTSAGTLPEMDPAELQAAGQLEQRPLGHGRMDIPALVKAAEAAGTQWLIVEQDQPSMGKTPLECAEISLQTLKSL